jgi:hypothetical protein
MAVLVTFDAGVMGTIRDLLSGRSWSRLILLYATNG